MSTLLLALALAAVAAWDVWGLVAARHWRAAWVVGGLWAVAIGLAVLWVGGIVMVSLARLMVRLVSPVAPYVP